MIRNVAIRFITIITLLVTANSCILNLVCIDGSGTIAIEERPENGFTRIINSTDADLIFTKGDLFSISVETDDNLLDIYKTSVSGNRLEIELDGAKCVRSSITTIIRVTAPIISEFALSGSGNMVGDTLNGATVKASNSGSGDIFIEYAFAEELNTKMSGSGDVTFYNSDSNEVSAIINGSGDFTIDGDSDLGFFTITGSGNCYCSNLQLNNATATISGSGNLYCSVESEIVANLSGSGNLYYIGSPTIYKTITGSGRVIRIVR